MLVGVGLEDRADRRVELRVHQHDRFAVFERLERNLRAELDRAGHVDQDVDLLRLAEECVVCDNRPPARMASSSSVTVDGTTTSSRPE